MTGIAATVLVVACGGVAGLPAHAGAAALDDDRLTTAPQNVSGRHLSQLPSLVQPLTSSSDTSEIGTRWSVFSRTDRTPNLWIYGSYTPDPTGQLVAVAANADHTTHAFGIRTDDMGPFSSSGKVVTAGTEDPRRFYYWVHPFKTVSSFPQDSTLVPEGYRYLTSAPDGWVEVDSANQMYDVNAWSKEASPLGPPLAGSPTSAVSGPTGVVVTYDSTIAFISFSTGQLTVLDSSELDQTDPQTNPPVCWSVSRRAAACGNTARDADGDPVTTDLFLEPLDGSPAFDVVHLHPNLNDDNPRVVGATFKDALAWLSTSEYDNLNIKTPDTLRTTPSGVGDNPVAGPGGFLTSNRRNTAVLVYDRRLQTRTLVAERPSRAEALSFSISDKSIAWTEDDGAPRGTALRVHRRSITTDGAGTRLGNTSTIADDAQRSSIAVSAAYTVYAVGAPQSHGWSHRLHVVSAGQSRTIEHVATKDDITLSGHRLLYAKSENEVAVVDLKNGATTTYTCMAADIDANQLVLAVRASDSDPWVANIREIDLDTGSERVVADGVNTYPIPTVFVHGSIVGWRDLAPDDPHFRPRSHYRDMTTEDPAVTLPADQMIWNLTDAGVLIEVMPGNPESSDFVYDSRMAYTPEIHFLLRPYESSEADPVLTGYYLKVGPEIAGGVMAWVDARGHLEARLIP